MLLDRFKIKFKSEYLFASVGMLFLAAVAISIFMKAAHPYHSKVASKYKYVDATSLRIINKGFDDTETAFSRLPESLRDSVRHTLWLRQLCSAGIGIRFATDSKDIRVRYDLLWNIHLMHVSDLGAKGVDLYIFDEDSVWRHVNTVHPIIKKGTVKTVEQFLVGHMAPGMKEFLMYLPLYDGVTSLDVVVDSGAVITPGASSVIDKDKKIVAYGTSILQGACTSHPGMAGTNIIGRELNCEVVNLGLNGECKLDLPIARAMASIQDADCYVIDPLANSSNKLNDTINIYNFIKTLRTLRPEVPVVMVEAPSFTFARYNSLDKNIASRKNAFFRRCYEQLKAEHGGNIYYVTAENLDGPHHEATVDGYHLSDLGFTYYAQKLTPVLREILYPDR